jgi:CDP-diacylglycerol--serine O-phosphatidyltransferase
MSEKNVLVRAFPALEYFNVANLLTILAIALDILIVYLALLGWTKWAFWLYVFVLGIDAFDGKVARLLKCSTEFGARLDSLCDGVSFCIMPAVMAVIMGFTTPVAVVLVILNAIAGIWRLAYFDLRGLLKVGDREYFIGLPTTRSAAVFYVALTFGGLFREHLDLLFYVFFAVSPPLMVSNIRMRKGSPVENSLFVILPLCAAAYLFIW